MVRLPFRLWLLNVLRWVRAHLAVWLLLAATYGAIAFGVLGLLPVPADSPATQAGSALAWGCVVASLVLPALFAWLDSSLLVGSFNPLGAVAKGFGEWLPPVGRLVFIQELRSGAYWLSIAAAAALGAVLPPGAEALWVVVVTLGIQRALYAMPGWRGVALGLRPTRAAGEFIVGLWAAHVPASVLACGVVGVARWLVWGTEAGTPWALAAWQGAVACVWSAAAAFEGDSGRPVLVHAVSLGAGALAGLIAGSSFWAGVAVLYFASRMPGAVRWRLKSAEAFHEDALVP